MGLPRSVVDLIDCFEMLPGVGEKTAERYVFSLEEKEMEEIENFSSSLLEFKKKIKKCSICGCLTDDDICDICRDKDRDQTTICIVSDSKSVFSFEKTNKYKGKYHVLNGLISPIEGRNPEDINIASLVNDRINNEHIEEIIIAINPSIEGEITSLYVQKILENKGIKVSRLSYGIPMGLDIEYLDPIMISKALDDRKVVS